MKYMNCDHVWVKLLYLMPESILLIIDGFWHVHEHFWLKITPEIIWSYISHINAFLRVTGKLWYEALNIKILFSPFLWNTLYIVVFVIGRSIQTHKVIINFKYVDANKTMDFSAKKSILWTSLLKWTELGALQMISMALQRLTQDSLGQNKFTIWRNTNLFYRLINWTLYKTKIGKYYISLLDDFKS